jgi:hypothetical protein
MMMIDDAISKDFAPFPLFQKSSSTISATRFTSTANEREARRRNKLQALMLIGPDIRVCYLTLAVRYPLDPRLKADVA